MFACHDRAVWRVMLLAEALSVIGDQLAKLALSALVWRETGSAALAALTYACTLLPDLLAGPLLAPLADRLPSRDLMVGCASASALLVALMSIPGLPFIVLAVCVAAVAALVAPFKSAQALMTRQLLGHRHHRGQAHLTMVRETGQLVGLGGAAVVVGWLGPTLALTIDAASFTLAAVLLAATPRQPQRYSTAAAPQSRRNAWRVVCREPLPRATVLSVLSVCAIVGPEAVIVPLVSELDSPPWVGGLLLGCDSLGMIGAAHLLTRPSSAIGPSHYSRLVPALALLTTVPLVSFLTANVTIGAVALLLSGAGASLLPLARAMLLDSVPEAVAGTVSGFVRTALRAGQGAVALVTGVVASLLQSPSAAVTVMGLIGSGLAVAAVFAWRRVSTGQPAARRDETTV